MKQNVCVMIGEIEGQLEADAAIGINPAEVRNPGYFIVGETAPAGRTMGYAGVIVDSDDTAQAKKRIMRENVVFMVDSPAEIGSKVAEVLAQ